MDVNKIILGFIKDIEKYENTTFNDLVKERLEKNLEEYIRELHIASVQLRMSPCRKSITRGLNK